ncbi:hypothetical protein [Candidatus Poriferisodalis sp.]|uniref:hypothetical protein n=1 Tax=Candidatus Poriferisodalis sp. TaxID=3101277 RepID=UPI003B01B071
MNNGTDQNTPPPQSARPAARTWPNVVTALAALALVAIAIVGWLTIRQDLTNLQDAIGEPVTVANPVDEVEIKNIVQTAAPRDALLYGSCYANDDGSYDISVVAFSGGIEQAVAVGTYADANAAALLAQDINAYYGGSLDFGDSSADCHDLDGWGP